MPTRIYEVKEADIDDILDNTRLVEASTASQALRHVVEPRFVVTVASAKRVGELMAAGHKIEVAGEAKAEAAAK